MVAATAADYSLPMTDTRTPQSYRVAERGGPAGRVLLRHDDADRRRMVVLAGYHGPDLPAHVTDSVIDAGEIPGTWQLKCAEGVIPFRAHAVDLLEERPALYLPLHRRFALTPGDRIAVRVLLWLLRLPGGASLMRRWQARTRP